MATSALHFGRTRNVHHLRGRYRLKDWRRIACRYDRCATIFLGAITLAAIVIFWLGQRVLSLKVILVLREIHQRHRVQDRCTMSSSGSQSCMSGGSRKA
jgi:hypothetical protein